MKSRNQNKETARKPVSPPETSFANPDAPTEPQGHVHPNFRHWNWFRPSDLK